MFLFQECCIWLVDSSGFSHEPNQFLLGNTASDASVEVGGYPQDFITSRPPPTVPQSFQGTSVQSVRGARSAYPQRPSPSFTASSSNSHLGHVATPDDSLRMIAENYSARHPRPLSTIGWRSSDRNSRSRISSSRHRSVADDVGVHDRLVSQVHLGEQFAHVQLQNCFFPNYFTWINTVETSVI